MRRRSKRKNSFKNIIKFIITFIIVLFIIFFTTKCILKHFIYPVNYLDNVVTANKENNTKVDPYLILSIIKTESGFNEKAVSSKNAKGLMQIMDSTANDVDSSSSDKDLHDASTNIKLGTLYFSNLIKKYSGNYLLAICAYNAGMGKVDSWIENGTIDDNFNEQDISKIPYKETKNYVSKVISSYKMYKILY